MTKSTNNLNSVGYRIKELRKKKNLRQTELAYLLGCAPNTVTEWEKRKGRVPGKKLLRKVAEVLGSSIDYLLNGEKQKVLEIPCYGEFSSEEFDWAKVETKYFIEIPQREYSSKRFCIKITDDLLEPSVCKNDYCIFEKILPEDGDIVIVRFPQKNNKTIIRMWRQEGLMGMLSETKLTKICSPCFFKVTKKNEKFSYKAKSYGKMIVEGKLVVVKKIKNIAKLSLKVNYIY